MADPRFAGLRADLDLLSDPDLYSDLPDVPNADWVRDEHLAATGHELRLGCCRRYAEIQAMIVDDHRRRSS